MSSWISCMTTTMVDISAATTILNLLIHHICLVTPVPVVVVALVDI